MPFLFLSDAQLEQWRVSPTDFGWQDLAPDFILSPHDLALMHERRRNRSKLGFAVQLCTLRFLGRFLDAPLEVPLVVVRSLARQLGCAVPRDLGRYAQRAGTLSKHQTLIRAHLGFRPWDDRAQFRLSRWLYRQVRLGDARPQALFEGAVTFLNTERIVRPAASTLARRVLRVRERASGLVELALSRRLSAAQCEALEALLLTPEGERKSRLDTLSRAPVRPSAPSLIAALERIEALRALKVEALIVRESLELALEHLQTSGHILGHHIRALNPRLLEVVLTVPLEVYRNSAAIAALTEPLDALSTTTVTVAPYVTF